MVDLGRSGSGAVANSIVDFVRLAFLLQYYSEMREKRKREKKGLLFPKVSFHSLAAMRLKGEEKKKKSALDDIRSECRLSCFKFLQQQQ